MVFIKLFLLLKLNKTTAKLIQSGFGSAQLRLFEQLLKKHHKKILYWGSRPAGEGWSQAKSQLNFV